MCGNKRRHEKSKCQPDFSHTLSFMKDCRLKLTSSQPANPCFLPVRRRGPGIDISARAVGPNRPRPEPKVTHVGIVLAARKFLGLLVGLSQDPGSRIGKRPGIKLWALDKRFHVDMVAISPRPTLHYVHGIAMRICVFIDPHLLVFKSH